MITWGENWSADEAELINIKACVTMLAPWMRRELQ